MRWLCFLKIWADPIVELHDQTFSHTVWSVISRYLNIKHCSLGEHQIIVWVGDTLQRLDVVLWQVGGSSERTVSRIARSEREAGERTGLMLAPTKHLIFPEQWTSLTNWTFRKRLLVLAVYKFPCFPPVCRWFTMKIVLLLLNFW